MRSHKLQLFIAEAEIRHFI